MAEQSGQENFQLAYVSTWFHHNSVPLKSLCYSEVTQKKVLPCKVSLVFNYAAYHIYSIFFILFVNDSDMFEDDRVFVFVT